MDCVAAGESKKENRLLMDFDYLVSQLYLQHCTFVEIGEGICSMFVELDVNSGSKKLQKQMFFGNCLCSEFQKWHLCNYHLTSQRPEDCVFQEGTSCPSTSARVHRRLCDVTGMSQWNPQCNCSVVLAGNKQDHLCGFRTCYVSPMPKFICGPRTVCGTAHCDLKMHGSMYSVRCDRKCRYHQPFCEDPCPSTSIRRSVSSEWAEWKSVSSPDSNCNIKQFETECLNEKKEPAYDCIGPGLLCCGKNEADCTCEVKIQDGKLRAFRYTITLGDHYDTQDSRIKARSTGLTGNAKVWNRFMGITSKDDKDDSISMFGKPLGLEAYRRNYIPEGQKSIVSDGVDVSLQNSGQTDARLFKGLASLLTNRSQSYKNIQGVNLHNNTGVNGTAKFERPDLQKLPTNKTTGAVKLNSHEGQKLVKPNGGQLQITPNNSTINTNLNPNVQNQQKDVQQINEISKEKSQYPFTLLPYITTKSVELQEKNSNNVQNMTGVRNISNEINEKAIKDDKGSVEKALINNNLSTGNNSQQQHNYNVQKLNEINQQKVSDENVVDRFKENSKNSSLNNVASRPEMSNNQNILLENSMVTTHQNSFINEIKTNKIENSLELPAGNVIDEIKTNKQQNKGTKDDKEESEDLNHINNPQKLYNFGKTSDNNKQTGESVLETNPKISKILNEDKDEDSSTDIKYINSVGSQIKPQDHDDNKNSDSSLENQENDSKVESILNPGTSEEKNTQESEQLKSVVNQEDFYEIQIRDRAKSQEKSSVLDEDKAEFNGKEYYQVVFPEHGEQYSNEEGKKETEHSGPSNIINQDITPHQKGSTILTNGNKISTKISYNNPPNNKLVDKQFTKGSTITSLNTLPLSLSQNNRQNISGHSNSVKFTTVGLEHNRVTQKNAKNNERNVVDQNLQNSLLGKLSKNENVGLLQKNTSAAVISKGQNKGESVTKQAVNKKAPLNTAQVLLSTTSERNTVLSTNPSSRSYSLNKNENEQTSQKSLLNELSNKDSIHQINTSITNVYQGQNKEESVKKEDMNKKGLLHTASITTPYGTTALLSEQSSRPDLALINENERNSQKSLPNELSDIFAIIPQQNNTTSVIPEGKSKEESVNKQPLETEAPFNDIANILPNGTPYGVTAMTIKPRASTHLDDEKEESVIKLSIQTKTTPDLWGSIARRLFKSSAQAITGDQQNLLTMFSDSNPSIVLPEENSSNDYDEPEPVLKDLNKVDKDNVDEKTAEALSKIADLNKHPGKVAWSEKSANHNYKLDFEKNKNQKDKENLNSLKKAFTLTERAEKGRKLISKLKPIS